MRRCSAITRAGERCQRSADGPHGLCWLHDPTRATERRENASRAAQAKAAGTSPSAEVEATAKLLKGLAGGALSGKIPEGRVAVAVQALNGQLRALELLRRWTEMDEAMQMIEEIERRLDARRVGA